MLDLTARTLFGEDPEERLQAARALRESVLPQNESPLPPFPNGWFVVGFADDLAAGGAIPVRLAGRDLVVYRTEGGVVHALDAYCRHLGAHLGVGGTVVGEVLECPFHGWQWRGDGRCAAVPYTDRVPPLARTTAYPVRDRNGFVFIWIHDKGEEPGWEIEEIPEVSDPNYRVVARYLTPFAGSMQDVVENGVDMPHFRTVHKWEVREIQWEPKDHTYTIGYDSLESIRGGGNSVLFQSLTEGPGFTRTRFWGAHQGVSIHGVTPAEDGIIKLFQLYVYHDDLPDKFALMAAEGSSLEWAADVPIWENKRYLPKPLLTNGDGPVTAYRHWFSQFYPASSESPAAEAVSVS